MATPVSTELDFDQIKSDIISYIKTDPTFTDYNFEGSALNAIINMLAYNTHTNAYYANMLHSEGFLDTAQKRSSVVSRSKELGYTTKSISGSQAYVDITVSGSTYPVLTLSRGTQFSSSNDNGSYSFIVVEDYLSTKVSDTDVFSSVRLVEGTLVSNSFLVDTSSNIKSIFNIPNKNIDTTTLKVYVRDTETSVNVEEYSKATSAYDLNSTSKIYFVQESYDGYFQIYFGSDILGVQPPNGSLISIEYVVSDNQELANECRTFIFDSTYGTSTLVSTTQVSFGGSNKESIDTIKYNAKLAFASRERAITTSDYEIVLKQSFDFIKSVAVWGGEDNVPPVYGKVFISIQPKTGYTISDAIKTDIILPLVKRSSVITVVPEIIDPTYTDIEFVTNLKFNQSKTILSKSIVEANIKSTIVSYIDSISTFNSDYLESALIQKIVELDPGISSISLSKKIGFKLSPLINVESSYDKYLNNYIEQGSLTSSIFNIFYEGSIVSVYFKEIDSSTTSMVDAYGIVQVTSRIGLFNSVGALIKEIGTINYSTGLISFSFSLYSYLTNNRFIYVRCKTVSPDIALSRNQILTLQDNIEDTLIGISSNNIINTMVYSK